MRDVANVCRLICDAVERLRGANDEDSQFDALNEIARLSGDEAMDIMLVRMERESAVAEAGGLQ